MCVANSLKQAIEDVEQMKLPIPLTIKHFKSLGA
jgi:hypothetical protein